MEKCCNVRGVSYGKWLEPLGMGALNDQHHVYIYIFVFHFTYKFIVYNTI